MKILIAAIGKAKNSPANQLYLEFVKRSSWKIVCKEFEVKNQNLIERKAKEAELLLAATIDYECIIALDESGKTLSSREFADKISKWQQGGISSFAFIIGGADGLDDLVLKKAKVTWSFGRVTWPHLLVRALLAEQLYRAQTLISGHPYHRE